MKRLYCLLFILCIGTNYVWAQQLSEESIRLKKVFTKYQEVKDAPEWHLRLIDAFPNNKDVFMDMFNAPEKDQLYHDSHDYMMAFKHSSNSYPDMALHKSLSISTELLTWSAGPVDDLQETIYHIALHNADTFIQTISLYNKKAIADIAHFLTSSQSGKLHPDYSKLIALLEVKEQKRLAKIFRKEIPDYER
ncbi:MAG: hypothetical protein R2800_00695 [Flavipsychrobacter sp.]